MSHSTVEVKLRKREIVAVVFIKDGWHLYDLARELILAGPFSDHADALENCKTRAFRIAQGWTP